MIFAGESAAMGMIRDIRALVRKVTKRKFLVKITKKIQGVFAMEKQGNG